MSERAYSTPPPEGAATKPETTPPAPIQLTEDQLDAIADRVVSRLVDLVERNHEGVAVRLRSALADVDWAFEDRDS